MDGEHYAVLVVVDGMSTFVWVGAQTNTTPKETIKVLLRCMDELIINPQTIVGEQYFGEPMLRS
eukprot:10161149-Prorocentrum_lima.AAC.1